MGIRTALPKREQQPEIRLVTGFEALQNQIFIINIGKHGKVPIDSRFHHPGSGTEPRIRFEAEHWPHGASALAVPHGCGAQSAMTYLSEVGRAGSGGIRPGKRPYRDSSRTPRRNAILKEALRSEFY